MARSRNRSRRELAEAALGQEEAQEAEVANEVDDNVQPPQVEEGVNNESEGTDDEEYEDEPSSQSSRKTHRTVPFALVPAQANRDIIDYRTSEGMKLFQSATQGLYKESSDRFDCDPEELLGFLTLVEAHSKMLGYHSIFQIPVSGLGRRPLRRDFLQYYGVISLEQVRAHAYTYVNEQTRTAQDSTQLFYCLWNSLSSAGRAKISIWDSDYTIDGQMAGVPMLKVIIRESDIDTQATAAYIRQQLSSLDEYMSTIDSDIKQFNIHVKSLVRQLEKRRQTSTDILSNLFKGYKAAADRPFVEYIKRQEEKYEEGEEMTPDQLMVLASNKYKNRLRNKEWMAPTPEESKILALEAKIQSLTRKEKKESKPSTKEKKKATKDKKGNNSKREKPAWMSKPPTDKEKGKSKTINNKEYWWCEALQVWARHKPSECRAVKKTDQDSKPQADSGNSKKKIKFANALSTVSDDEE